MIKVIFADDHVMARQGVELMLSNVDDIELVACAKSGEELVKLAQRMNPDVALIDVRMDGMGGLGAVRKLRQRLPSCAIIGITGHNDTTYPALFFQAGALGYLSKEAPLNELVGAIRSAHAGEPYFDERVASHVAESRTAIENPFLDLSERERQVCSHISDGLDEDTIKEKLGVRVRTVRVYRQRAFEKLNIKSDIELLRLSLRFGNTEP